MRKRFAGTVIVAALTVTALLLLATTASAAPQGKSKKMTVSGNSTPSACNDGKGVGAIELKGDIEGCLTFFPKRYTCEELNGFALFKEWGRETFKGKLNGKSGTFRTKYKIVGTYKQDTCEAINAASTGNGDWPAAHQITGTCDHKIVRRSTTGAFKGYRGVITFYDHIPIVGEGATNFYYAATLKKRAK